MSFNTNSDDSEDGTEKIFKFTLSKSCEFQPGLSYISLNEYSNITYIKIVCDDKLILLYRYHPLDKTLMFKLTNNAKYIYIEDEHIFKVFLNNFINHPILVNSYIKIHIKCEEPIIINVNFNFHQSYPDSKQYTFIWNYNRQFKFTSVIAMCSLIQKIKCKKEIKDKNIVEREQLIIEGSDYLYRKMVYSHPIEVCSDKLDFNIEDSENLLALSISPPLPFNN